MKRLFICLSFLVVIFCGQAQASSSPKNILVQPAHMKTPGYCEIEVANQSQLGAYVDIEYDNYEQRNHNYVAPGYSLYIPLYYYNYCHSYATLAIYSIYNEFLYYGSTEVGHTVYIVPGLKEKQLQVKVQ